MYVSSLFVRHIGFLLSRLTAMFIGKTLSFSLATRAVVDIPDSPYLWCTDGVV